MLTAEWWWPGGTGIRIRETRKITWQAVDFENKQIAVRGDEATGTKNWEVRRASGNSVHLLLLRAKTFGRIDPKEYYGH